MSEPVIAMPDERLKQILLVEDEPLLRIALAEELVRAGFRVISAAHADEALSILHSAIHVDILVTDITMPGGSIDGLQLAARVRAVSPRIKIVIASAYVSGRFHNDIADAWLGKPEVLHQLVDLVQSLLRNT